MSVSTRPHSGLRQIIGRQPEARALVSALADALGAPVAIEDADGRLLHGASAAGRRRDERVRRCGTARPASGWVTGPRARARRSRRCSSTWSPTEIERKALGAEVLHLYREINLIYSFSEKLAALLDVERVARLTLQEARHLIVATDGVVMLLDEASGALSSVAGFGDELTALRGLPARPRHRRRASPPAASARSSTTSTATRGA